MRKLTAGLFSSIDGVVEAPDTFQFDSFDDDLGQMLGEVMGNTTTVLLGRVSYEEWAGYWPTANDGGWRISSAVRQQLPLVSLTRSELQPGSIDRVIDFTVPHEAADQDWRWRVVVLGRKDRVRVPVREDSYPVRIEGGRRTRS